MKHNQSKFKNLLDFYKEPTPKVFEGEYNNLLFKLISSTWIVVVYVVISIIIVYSLSYSNSTILFYVAFEIPIIIACSYVVSNNSNLSVRLTVNWFITAFIAGLFFAGQISTNNTAKGYIGDAIGLFIWLFLIYWIGIAITWSVKTWKFNLLHDNRNEIIRLIAYLAQLWGVTLQIFFIISWTILPYIEIITFGAPTGSAITNVIEITRTYSILKYLPFSIFLLGVLILASIRFDKSPYKPKTLQDVLVTNGTNIIFVSLFSMLRIPVWIVINILGFIRQFSIHIWMTILEFFEVYIARFICLFVGLIAGPAILLLGHFLVLFGLNGLSYYLTEDLTTLRAILDFIIVNGLIISALSCYVLAMPLLQVNYRNENIETIKGAIQKTVIQEGKDVVKVIGQAFSLFGIMAFIIPITSLLPGGTGFGIFSAIYSLIVITTLVFYYFNKSKKTDIEKNANK